MQKSKMYVSCAHVVKVEFNFNKWKVLNNKYSFKHAIIIFKIINNFLKFLQILFNSNKLINKKIICSKSYRTNYFVKNLKKVKQIFN